MEIGNVSIKVRNTKRERERERERNKQTDKYICGE